MKIVADDKIPFLKGALEPYAEVIYMPGKAISNEIIKDANALLIRTRTKCNRDLLQNTRIRFIGTATIGFDHIDTEYCDELNIRWTNAPGCNSSSVRQYIASVLLSLAAAFSFSLRDRTLGIIGVGHVGSKVVELAKALGMRVLLNDPPRKREEGGNEFVDLEHILQESDIITVHVPLTKAGIDRTYHLFDEATFGRMKDKSIFINTSRGEVVDSDALGKALDARRLAGSVLDVWEHEPDIDLSLLSKVHIGTPHIAGYSADGKANGIAMVVNALCRFFDLSPGNWYPSDVPEPETPVLRIDCRGHSSEDIIAMAVRHTYDVRKDEEIFRKFPGTFESLRGNYPLRREFTSYYVKPDYCDDSVIMTLRKIGFKII